MPLVISLALPTATNQLLAFIGKYEPSKTLIEIILTEAKSLLLRYWLYIEKLQYLLERYQQFTAFIRHIAHGFLELIFTAVFYTVWWSPNQFTSDNHWTSNPIAIGNVTTSYKIERYDIDERDWYVLCLTLSLWLVPKV